MSYSFSKRGATRAIVMGLVVAALDEVVAQQPIHAADRKQAEAAAQSFLDIVPEANENQEYFVSVSGSVAYTWDGEKNVVKEVVGASINVNASLVNKE